MRFPAPHTRPGLTRTGHGCDSTNLRHSFASLPLHEGRSVIYVARQLGHGAALTLGTYGHVVDELDEQPRQDAEGAILAARSSAWARRPVSCPSPRADRRCEQARTHQNPKRAFAGIFSEWSQAGSNPLCQRLVSVSPDVDREGGLPDAWLTHCLVGSLAYRLPTEFDDRLRSDEGRCRVLGDFGELGPVVR